MSARASLHAARTPLPSILSIHDGLIHRRHLPIRGTERSVAVDKGPTNSSRVLETRNPLGMQIREYRARRGIPPTNYIIIFTRF